MSIERDEFLVLRYLDGNLSEEEASFLENASDVEARDKEIQEYRALLGLEQLVAVSQESLEEDLSSSVLAQIEALESARNTVSVEESSIPTVSSEPVSRLRNVYLGLISANAVLLVILAVLIRSTPTSVEPISRFSSSTNGFATVALELPLTQEAAAKLDRVDLQVAYVDAGKNVRRELARFIPVVDVQAVNDSALAKSRVYIVVPREQLENLQLARLFGEIEISPINSDSKGQQKSSTLKDPRGRIIQVSQEESPEVLYYRQYSSAGVERLVYQSGQWVAQPQVSIQAF